MNAWIRRVLGWGGWGAVLVAASAAGRAVADVSVTLRSAATIPMMSDAGKGGAGAGGGGGAITLADIALIDPPTTEEATKIAEIVVIPAGTLSTSTSISIAQVRAAMDAAKVHWGHISLRGSACELTRAGANAGAAKPGTSSASAAPRLGLSQTTPQIVEVGQNGPETIRQAVCTRLVDLYGVDPSDLRIAFDDKDEEFLAQPVAPSGTDRRMERRVDVQPGGTGGSVRTPVSIAIYEGDRIVATRAIAVQALINRTVVTARAPIQRGEVVGDDAVEVARQWMGPNAKLPASPDAAVGQVATRGILAGAVLTAADLAAPIACKRGDLVWVHALSGPLTIKAKCFAQGTARDGEMVQLKMEGSNRVFSARMSGIGRAVLLTDAQPAAGDAGSAGNAGTSTSIPAESTLTISVPTWIPNSTPRRTRRTN